MKAKLNSIQTLMTLGDATKPVIRHRANKMKKSKVLLPVGESQVTWALRNGHTSWLLSQVK